MADQPGWHRQLDGLIPSDWYVAQDDGDHVMLVRWTDRLLSVCHVDAVQVRARCTSRQQASRWFRDGQQKLRAVVPDPTVSVATGWTAIAALLDAISTTNI